MQPTIASILLTFYFCLRFSVVKEEIIDDDAHLPCFNGRVISWVICLYYLKV